MKSRLATVKVDGHLDDLDWILAETYTRHLLCQAGILANIAYMQARRKPSYDKCTLQCQNAVLFFTCTLT